MRVLQKIGPDSGKVVDMPFDVAQGCVAQGTAEIVTEELEVATPEELTTEDHKEKTRKKPK